MKKQLIFLTLAAIQLPCFAMQKSVETKHNSETQSTVDITKFWDYVSDGDAAAVMACLRKQPDLKDEANADGTTPLYVAACNGHIEVVKVLIAAQADINQARNDTGATPLWIAADCGHTEVVKALIAAQADINQAINGIDTTPLYAAAWSGHTEVVKTLIAAGADVNQAAINGSTPLAVACSCNRITAMRLLLGVPSIQSDFTAQFWYQDVPGNMRYRMNKKATRIFDNARTGENKKLFEAIEKNDVDAVKVAIAIIEDIHVYDTGSSSEQKEAKEKSEKAEMLLWNTPLHCAVQKYATLLQQTTKDKDAQLFKLTKCKRIVHEIVQKNPMLWYVPNSKDISPLSLVINNKFKALQYLLPEKDKSKRQILNQYVLDDISALIQQYDIDTKSLDEIEQSYDEGSSCIIS